MKLVYWIAKIGNLIVVAAWLLIVLVAFIPLSCVFLKKITYTCDKVTGKTNLTWSDFIDVVRADGLFGRMSGIFIKFGINSISDLIEHDLMDEYIYILV